MDLQELEKEALSTLNQVQTLSDLESFHAKYLGRKEGELTKILRSLGQLPSEQRKLLGAQANQIRTRLEEIYSERENQYKSADIQSKLISTDFDPTLPGRSKNIGHSHIILSTIRDIQKIFLKLGFDSVKGPEVETDDNNFSALNIPANHPARDMQDTFYLHEKDESHDGESLPLLMRTHTSPVQIRLMRQMAPPIRIIAPGRVYRNEAVDATHAAVFHQIEGLAIDQDISFADLKGTLTYFAKELFGSDIKVRFRPSYFPFVEPGAEMDVLWESKNSKTGEKSSRWLEMLGSGMVHPQVLRNVDYDSKKWRGYAFGMGIERIVMIRYGIPDIRMFLESDLRFLEQFS